MFVASRHMEITAPETNTLENKSLQMSYRRHDLALSLCTWCIPRSSQHPSFKGFWRVGIFWRACF